MPDSPTDLAEISTRLRSHLRTLMPTAELTEAAAVPALPAFLLLKTSHNLAAFALPNGDWRANYEPLYEGFKRLCSERTREWDALDVNFVFCVPRPEADFDTFCSQIETDVYFCRKFVIPLDGDVPQALARLPFLPLDPLQGAGLRPDSAQVFLQRHGVSPLLARYLVLPHQRGPAEIINDCLALEFGEPKLTAPIPRTAPAPDDRLQKPMRIERIEIENFRAYRQRQSFEIASDVTVLYGPNGFGKTSFFDAIDFAVTGEIGRLDALSDAQFLKAATHLDSEPPKSVVSLTAANNGTKLQVVRTVEGRNRATLNGERKDRKSILTSLTGAGSRSTERIDHLVRLFRATHQFNQEEQELTREFQKDCRLSADIVSRMLAFEDYNNAVGKAERVHADMQQAVDDQEIAIKQFETQIAADRLEIQRLSRPAQIDGSLISLQDEIATVRTKLLAAGFQADQDPVDAAAVRGWRANVESRHAEATSQATRLNELAKDLPLLPQSRQQLAARLQRLAVKEKEQAEADTRRTSAELAGQRSDQLVTELNTKLKEVSELENHVHSGICPVCAADYRDKGTLIQRIRTHVPADAASEARRLLQQVREKIAAKKIVLADLAAKKLRADQQLAALAPEKKTLETAVAAFVQSAQSAGFFPESPAGHFMDELGRRITALNGEAAQLETPIKETRDQLNLLRQSLAVSQRITQQKQVERDEKTKTLTRLRADLARMRADPRLGQLSLDIEAEQLSAHELAAADQLTRVRDDLKVAGPDAALKKNQTAIARQVANALKPEVQSLRSQIAGDRKWISDFESRLVAMELSPDLTPDALADLLKEESQRQAELAVLRDSTANLELAIDAATTAAALSRLSDQIHAAEKLKSAADTDRQRRKPWLEYFGELRTLLGAQQNTAIATFTREYGPRASVIQRRLRSVYGFDDITLSPDESDIVVRATRRGEPLRPIDYFSQSQQQTLLLALFLTACTSQTWSNFCPILLDDPVTHFDDLNTYAFLDLIVGLLDSPTGPRQFILSTCDERLFQLARQKFRHLGKRAQFYTFLSSGKDGPQIEALST